MPKEPLPYLLVALGGALGAVARYAIATWVQSESGNPRFPIGTFTVNMLGCLLLGIVGTAIVERFDAEPAFLRYAIAIGFLGAFTTYSTFAFEKHYLAETGGWFLMSAYAALTVFLGLLLVRAGALIVRLVS